MYDEYSESTQRYYHLLLLGITLTARTVKTRTCQYGGESVDRKQQTTKMADNRIE